MTRTSLVTVMTRAKLWLYTCIGITLLLLLTQFIVFRIPAVYNLNHKTYHYDHCWWVDEPSDHIVFGSSNAMNAIIPKQICQHGKLPQGSVLNLGFNGATPFFMYRNLKLYLERFPFPKRIDIVFTPVMLQESILHKTDHEKIWLNLKQWNILSSRGEVNHSYFFPSMMFWESCQWDPMKLFKQYHFDLGQTRARRGYQPINVSTYYEKEQEAYFPHLSPDFPWSRGQVAILKKMVDMAHEHSCAVYFVLTPFHPKLFKAYHSRSEVLKGLEELFHHELGELTFIGSMNPEHYDLQQEHFHNPDHLNSKGARVFTQMCYNNLKDHRRRTKTSLLDTTFVDIKP
jgi:hypothetical protein